MENQPENILWMAEELDFPPMTAWEQSELARASDRFLEMVAAKGLRHCLYPA